MSKKKFTENFIIQAMMFKKFKSSWLITFLCYAILAVIVIAIGNAAEWWDVYEWLH